MTFQQRRFVDELLMDPEMNASAAARKAYPKATEESARQIGSENLAKPLILAEIRRRLQPSMVKARVTKERVLGAIADAVNRDVAEAYRDDGTLMTVPEMPPALRRQVVSLEVDEIRLGKDGPVVGYTKKLKLTDHLRGVELAARHHKMLTDKVEVEDTTGKAERIKRARERARKAG